MAEPPAARPSRPGGIWPIHQQLLAMAGLLSAVTLLVVAIPGARVELESLTGRVALEMAVVAAMGTAALLLAVLRRTGGHTVRGRDAFVAALIVQAVVNVVFGILPALAGATPTLERTFYPWLAGRYAAGALFLAAALRVRRTRTLRTVVASLAVVAAVEVAIGVFGPRLPIPPEIPPGELAAPGVHTLLEVGSMMLFGVGAVIAGRNAARSGEPLERWLALSLVAGVFTQLHEALQPAALGAVITSADLIRALSALLLTIGAAQQVVRLQRQRDRAVMLLQGDLERNRRVLEEVRAAREREAAFVSVVTHELSTPLATINAQVHILQMLGTDDRSREHLDAVGVEAERLSGLVKRMEELKAIDDPGFTVEPRPVAIAPLLEEVGMFARGLPGDHEVIVSAEGARVRADPVRFGQVLRNVVANATRYAPPGTLITISGSQADEATYQVTVADEGPGVRDDRVQVLFDAYARGRAAGGTEGAGLGLHVARRIMQAHHGGIEFVDPATPGARVRMTLPIAA